MAISLLLEKIEEAQEYVVYETTYPVAYETQETMHGKKRFQPIEVKGRYKFHKQTLTSELVADQSDIYFLDKEQIYQRCLYKLKQWAAKGDFPEKTGYYA